MDGSRQGIIPAPVAPEKWCIQSMGDTRAASNAAADLSPTDPPMGLILQDKTRPLAHWAVVIGIGGWLSPGRATSEQGVSQCVCGGGGGGLTELHDHAFHMRTAAYQGPALHMLEQCLGTRTRYARCTMRVLQMQPKAAHAWDTASI